MSELADNLARVRERIAHAAARAGRDPADVTLVAVTKGQPVSIVQALWELGLRDFGENRVQEALPKVDRGPADARWHLIGPLQENKINKVLGWVTLIQSVDSLRLAEGLSKRAHRSERTIPVLLEVKTSDEPTKHGVATDEALDLFGAIAELPYLSARGLMTIAPRTEDTAQVRRSFATLRRLLERLRSAHPDAHVVSMGMSDDLEIAVEEGATMVRVGRALAAR